MKESVDEQPDEECPNIADCPYCAAPFHICALFPEPGSGGYKKAVCENCLNLFEISEEVQIVYEVHEGPPRSSRRD